jgi:F420-non-reducing hydrogenase iron-sulfur subunit
VEHVRQILEQIGLEGQRVQMINLSAAMAGEFTFAAAEITSEIKALGPSPLRDFGENGREPKRGGDAPDKELESAENDRRS